MRTFSILTGAGIAFGLAISTISCSGSVRVLDGSREFRPAIICPPQMVCEIDPERDTVSKAWEAQLAKDLEHCAAQ